MAYSTDLTDEQWAVIEPIVTYQSEDDHYKGGRRRTVDLRRVVDAFYIKPEQVSNGDC